MLVRVECALDDYGALLPRRLFLGATPIELAELLDRWPGADHTYFKLRAESGATFILRHDPVQATWELTLYQSRSEASWR